VEFEARRGCGLRACAPGVTSAFRCGDLVYTPPKRGSTQPGVAVVLVAECAFGFGGDACVPTGDLRLLPWDVHNSKFSSARWASDRDLVLLPQCCGRGTQCPHLLIFAEPRQWPNGDEMDLHALLPIPEALASFLRTELRQPCQEHQQELERSFKTLLGTHFNLPTDRQKVTLGKRAPLASLSNLSGTKQQKGSHKGPGEATAVTESSSEDSDESGSECGSESSYHSNSEPESECGSESSYYSDSEPDIQNVAPDVELDRCM